MQCFWTMAEKYLLVTSGKTTAQVQGLYESMHTIS